MISGSGERRIETGCRTCGTAAVIGAALLHAAAMAQTPLPLKVGVYPPQVRLDGSGDVQSLVVRGVSGSGVTIDLTAEAGIAASDAALVRIASGVVSPLADGTGKLVVHAGGATIETPVDVRNAGAAPAVRFGRDVMPVLARAGCSSGACHGSARGQDGFHLSLFGYDPAGDHHALIRELPGRRVNLALPDESLLLLKATGAVPHTGGKRIDRDDAMYATLTAWLRAGAPADPPDAPVVTGLELFPPELVLEGEGARHRLVARATWSDGSDADVTRLATFISGNDTAATVDAAGVVTSGRPGESLVLARFDALTAGIPVVVVAAGAADIGPAPPEASLIDRLIHEKLRRLRIAPSEICDDATFLRRVHLDLVGLLPTPDETAAFLSSGDANRRERLIDRLLERKEFIELWVMKWAERLGIRTTLLVSPKATLLYHNWLQERIAAGMPINAIVRELVSASGGTFTNPATNFYQIEQDTLKLTENVAQAFLGIRLQCAQCHNHPFDRWTMNDYYAFAAFFAQIGRKVGEDPRETIVFNSGGGEMRHPVGGRNMAPAFLGGPVAELNGRDRRAALAGWLTSRDNRLFARNVANFAWAHFFGRGIVEPIDDVRISNPPSNGPLLESLADMLIESDFDLRGLCRAICLSQAYQRSTQASATNGEDTANFSRALVRPLRAESLLDCISQVTGTGEKFPGLPAGARAVQIADGNVTSAFLSTFGREPRETGGACPGNVEPSLSQALHLINGETLQRKIRDGGVVAGLLAAGRTPDEVIDHVYLACLMRRPTEAERSGIHAALAGAGDMKAALEDVFWAVLNSKEFVFNH